jgi:hypothetical protein
MNGSIPAMLVLTRCLTLTDPSQGVPMNYIPYKDFSINQTEQLRQLNNLNVFQQASELFPYAREFTKEEAALYKESIQTLFKKTGRKLFA